MPTTPIVLFKAEEITSQQPSTFFTSCQTLLFRSAKEFVRIHRFRLGSLEKPIVDTIPARMLTVNCKGKQLTYASLQQTCTLNNQTSRAANAQEVLSYLDPTPFGGCHGVRPTAYFPVLGEQLLDCKGNTVFDKVLVLRYDPASPNHILFRLVSRDELTSLREIAIPLVMKDPDPRWSVPLQIAVTSSPSPLLRKLATA